MMDDSVVAELEKIQKNGSEQPVLFDKDDYYKTERSPFKRQVCGNLCKI